MKKVIITGCSRSGTTALAELLSNSPNILITNEVGNFTFIEEDSLEPVLARKYEIENFRRILNNKGIYEEYYQHKSFFENTSYIKNLHENYNLSVIGDKWPDYLFHIRDIAMMNNGLSDFYFIFTIRSCFHFINSSTSAYNRGLRNVWNFNDPKVAEAYWLKHNKELINNVTLLNNRNIPCLIVNYENHVSNPKKLISNIEDFISEKITINNPEEIYHFRGEEMKIDLNRETKIIMELLGYKI